MMMTLGDLLERNVRRHPHKTALTCVNEGVSLSYLELEQRVNSLVAALMAMGIKRGDRVATLSHNCHRYAEIFMALTKGGWVLVPLDHRLTARELSYLIENSEKMGNYLIKRLTELKEKYEIIRSHSEK